MENHCALPMAVKPLNGIELVCYTAYASQSERIFPQECVWEKSEEKQENRQVESCMNNTITLVITNALIVSSTDFLVLNQMLHPIKWLVVNGGIINDWWD